MIPPLDDRGLLPAGVWDCTLEEIAARFVTNDHRRNLWAGMTLFIEEKYRPAGLSCPLWVDGSFVRSKPSPSDVDVVLDVSSFAPEAAVQLAIGLRIQHDEIKARYHVDLWVRHPILPNDIALYFQYLGDKAAVELRLRPDDPKGILRVVP